MRYLADHEGKTRGSFDFPAELYYVNAADPRYEMPFHWHMECELIYVREGSSSLLLDGKSVSLTAGECAFISDAVRLRI